MKKLIDIILFCKMRENKERERERRFLERIVIF